MSEATCETALIISPGSLVSGSTVLNENISEYCGTITYDGKWYRFNTAETSPLSISIQANFTTNLIVLTGTCQELSCVVNNNHNSITEICCIQDVDYYIFVGGAMDNLVGDFTLTFILGAAGSCTPNLEAVPIISLPATIGTGQSCDMPSEIEMTTTWTPIFGATSQDVENSFESCAFSAYNGAWYHINVASQGQVTISTEGTRFDTVLNVITDSCDEFYCVSSNDDFEENTYSQVQFCAEAGEDYFIFIGGYSPSAVGNFVLYVSINEEALCQPEGITCDYGFPLELLADEYLILTGVTSLALENSAVGCTEQISYGYWYTFNNNYSSEMVISTAGSDFDTALAVFQGPSCDTISCVVSNNDFEAALTSQVEFCAVQKYDYYIFIGAPNAASGHYTLSISTATVDFCPLNQGEGCSTAFPITLTDSGIFTLTGSTATTINNYIECGTKSAFNGYWYTFRNNFVAGISISTTGSDTGTIIAVASDICQSEFCGIAATGATGFCASAATDFYVFVGSNVIDSEVEYTMTITTFPMPSCPAFGGTCGSCDSAAELTGSSSRNEQTSVLLKNDATGCSDTAFNGVWYHISSSTTHQVSISTAGSLFDTVIIVYTGTCADLTCLLSNDDTAVDLSSEVNFCASSNVEYYIFIGGATSNDIGGLDIHVTFLENACDVPGVLCQTALSVTLASDSPTTVQGITSNVLLNVASCSNVQAFNGLYYSFRNPYASEVTASSATSSFDTSLIVLSESCHEPTCIAVNDDSESSVYARVKFCAAANVDYFVFIGGSSDQDSGSFVLTLTTDTQARCAFTCEDALLITLPKDSSLVLTGATEPFGNSANTQCDPNPFDGYWYRFRSAFSSQLVISTTGSDFPTRLVVSYGPDCSVLPCLASGGTLSPASFCASQNVDYYVFLGGSAPASSFGNFVLSFTTTSVTTCNSIGVGCETAIPVTLLPNDEVVITGSNYPELGNYLTDCNKAAYNGFWYSFTNSFAALVTISTFGSEIDTALVVVGDSCAEYGCIASNDDFDGLSSEVEFCAPAGFQFLVFIGAYSRDADSENAMFGNYKATFSAPIVASCNIPGITCDVAMPIAVIADNQIAVIERTSRALNNEVKACPDIAYNGYWYVINNQFASEIVLSTVGADFDTVLAVFLGSCGSLTCVTSNDDAANDLGSKVNFCAVQATTYYVFVGSHDPDSIGNVVMSVSSNPYACDQVGKSCFLPNEITIQQDSFQLLSGATDRGLSNPIGPFAQCFSKITFNGVWYHMNLPFSSNIVVYTGTSSFGALFLTFTGSCADYTCISSVEDFQGNDQIEFCAFPLTDYYIFIGSLNEDPVNYNIIVTTSAVDFCIPPGVLCVDALAIQPFPQDSMVLSGNTAGISGVSDASCAAVAHNGFFYHFKNDFSSQMSVSTAGSAFDTILNIYSGSDCENLECVSSNDDFGFSETSQVSFCAQQNTDYFIYVGGAATVESGFFILIVSTGAPVQTCASSGLACSNPLPLLLTPNSGNVVLTGSTSIANRNYILDCNHASYDGVWFSFTNNFAAQLTFSTAGSNFDTSLVVIGGLCENFGCAGSNATQSVQSPTVSVCAPAGLSFFLFVGGSAEDTVGNYTLTVSVSPVSTCILPGSSCSSAIEKSLLSNSEFIYSGTTSLLLNNAVEECDNAAYQGYWYHFSNDFTADFTISTDGSSFDTVLVAYSGSCGNLVCKQSNDDFFFLYSQLSFCAAPGEFYVFVGGVHPRAVGDYFLHVSNAETLSCVLPSSVCEQAEPVTLIASNTVTVSGATTLPIGNSFSECGSTAKNGYWYTFTNPFFSEVVVTAESTYYSALVVLSGSCDTFTCEASIENRNDYSTTISFCAAADISYFVFNGGAGSSEVGSYSLAFTSYPRTSCDLTGVDCFDANTVTLASVDDSKSFVSYSSSALQIELSTCPSLDVLYHGIWYRFRNSFSSQITVSSAGSDFNTVLAIYAGSCSQPQCLSSNIGSSLTFCASSAINYYVVVGGFTNDDFGRFALEINSTSDSPDCCVSKCSGKQCGSDGCTGSCGSCTVGSSCVDSICVPNPSPSRPPSPSASRSATPSRSSTNTATFIRGSDSRSPTRSISHSRTSSKSVAASVSPSPVAGPSESSSASRIARVSASPVGGSASRSATPSQSFLNATRTPAPGDSTSFELAIVLAPENNQTDKSVASTQSNIENLLESELNQGAKVTVTSVEGDDVLVLICDTTESDLDNLLKAFDDGTFRGTVLDGAQVDNVRPDVDCDVSSLEIYSSTSNIDTITLEPSEGSVLAVSLMLFVVLFF